MATIGYTSNLRLRIEDNMSSAAVYNLQRIDELGAVFKLDETSATNVSSAQDVIVRPNNPAAGGTGIGGSIFLGIQAQPAELLEVNATTVSFGNAKLTGSFKIPWANIDPEGGGVSNFPDFSSAVSNNASVRAATAHATRQDNPHNVSASQLGVYTQAQVDNLLSAKANLTLLSSHTSASSGVHGLSGQVVGTTDAQTLVNKYLDANDNRILNIKDTNVSPDANIHGSKIRPEFGNQIIRSSAGLRLDSQGGQYVTLLPSAAIQAYPLSFRLPSTYGSVGQVLATDGQGNLSWQNAAGAAIVEESFLWYDSDGSEKTIVHSFNTQSLDITIRDLVDNELIYIPEINIIDNNTIHMIASEAPSNAWQITIQGVAR